jgi:RNA polymerase sigma-70 factor (ECF subfamily)
MVKGVHNPRHEGQPIDDGDLDRIYRTEAPRLARYLGRRLKSGQDALDLVHEAFLRFATVRGEPILERPAAYLQRIARNLLIDRARRPESRLAAAHVPVDDELEIATPPTQEQEIEVADVMRQYRQALDELPSRTRDVFLLHRVHDLTYREIAERLGISVPTVQYHMARALVHLDERLERP